MLFCKAHQDVLDNYKAVAAITWYLGLEGIQTVADNTPTSELAYCSFIITTREMMLLLSMPILPDVFSILSAIKFDSLPYSHICFIPIYTFVSLP